MSTTKVKIIIEGISSQDELKSVLKVIDLIALDRAAFSHLPNIEFEVVQKLGPLCLDKPSVPDILNKLP